MGTTETHGLLPNAQRRSGPSHTQTAITKATTRPIVLRVIQSLSAALALSTGTL